MYYVTLFILFVTSIVAAQQKPERNNDAVIDSLFEAAYKQKNTFQHEQCLLTTKQIINRAEKINEKKHIADAYNFYELMYIGWVETKVANDMAMKINRELGDTLRITNTILNQVFSKLFLINDTTTASTLIGEIEYLSQLSNNKNNLNKIHFAKGSLYLIEGRNELALQEYEKAMEKHYKYEDNYMKAFILIGMSKAYLNEEKIDKAEEYLQKSMALVENEKYPYVKVNHKKLLSQILSKKGAFKKSNNALYDYIELKDSIGQKAGFEIQMLTKQTFKENIQSVQIDKLTKQNKIKDKEVLTTSILLGIISLLTIALYRSNLNVRNTNKELKENNNMLLISKDRVEKASQAKTEFLSTVSHELRTPLYAVTGITNMLMNDNPLDRQKEHLQTLKMSGDFLLNLINDILHLNSLDKNNVQVQQLSFDLKKEVQSIISTLILKAKERNNQLVLEFDPLIQKQIIGDPLKLAQVLINLIGNAIKFTKDGTITVRIELLESLTEEQKVRFSVIDTGIGITKEQQKIIFQNFRQGSVDINRKYGGTGLGLAIVSKVLALKEATIHLESKEGEGSKFYYDIWIDKSQEVKKPNNIITYHDHQSIKGLHILLVDDNKVNQMVSGRILKDKGMSYEVANNGREAIELANKNKYDLILMDLLMPEVCGYTATKEIRLFDQKTPIIALTAISMDQDTRDLYSSGFDDIIMKPFKPEYLYDKIASMLCDVST